MPPPGPPTPKLGRRLTVARNAPVERRHRIEVVQQGGTYSAFGYHSARVTSKDGRSPTQGSGDAHAQLHRIRLLDQAREFMRDNGIYSRMVDGATSYIVGNGFGVQAKTGSPGWNEQAETVFREWGERPEIRGLQSWLEVERAVCREVLGAGEVGTMFLKDGTIQLIEAEQIAGKTNQDDGLLRDKVGRIRGYRVAPYAKSGAVDISRAEEVSADLMLFITRPERPSMARAVPPLQSSFPMLHRIKDVCDSEAIAWQMLARVALIINRANAGLLAQQTSVADDAKSGEDTEGDFATRVHELDQALIFHGEFGEDIKGVERNIPGKDFPQSIVTFIRLAGIALGIPLEVILLDWTKSNYSQSRAVLEQFHTAFQSWQLLLESFFHRPIYRWVIGRAIDEGRLRKREDWQRVDFIKPTFPWIDPRAEAEAQGMKLDRSFCTHAQVLKSQGYDRAEILDAREAEVMDAIERAKRIETKYPGVKVSWETFAGLEVQPKPPAPPTGAKSGGDADEKPGKPKEDDE